MGESIAVTKPIVVTAKTKPLAVFREAGMFGDQFGKVVIYGHQPTIVCEPTQVITGVVVDRESDEPLAGVDIYSDRFSDVPISGIRDLKTTTDNDGRFQLTGMPVGPDNEISAFPRTDGETAMPYLARDIAVPAANGLQPVDLRIELQRGAWVHGKVVDKKTGQPIAAARITYKPYNDNELAVKLYADSRIPHAIGYLETKDDGLFQFVALPGKALVDVWVVRAPYYPPGQGWDEIPSERIDHLGNILSQGYPSNRQHPTAMKEINVVDRQSIDDLVYELDPGKSILVKLQDSTGKPLQGVKIENASSNVNQDFHAKDQSEFQATGFLEGQRRTLTFYHKDKNLGQIKTIGYDDESPVIVTLQPNATITGKLVDSDGDPLPRANIRFDLKENRNYFIKSSPFKYITDENGVFNQIAIPGRYKVQVETLDGFYVLDLGLDITPGAKIDLGTLDVAAISKKIMDWDPKYEPTTLAETKSGADGVFALKIEKQEFERLNPAGNGKVYTALVVQAAGYGGSQTNWADFSGSEPLKISLIPEHKIAGRVVDLEGTPVVGASVKFSYAKPLGKQVADRFLETLQRTGSRLKAQDVFEQPIPNIDFVSGAIEPVVETDERGEFEFRGIPRDAMVTLSIENRQVTTQLINVLARSMGAVDADPNYKIFGDRPLVVTQPSRPIVGTVLDSTSGRPIRGATVLCTKTGVSDGVFGTGVAPRVETDQEGRFELLGLPKSADTRLMVYPPKDQPYLIKEVYSVPDTVGFKPADILRNQLIESCRGRRGSMEHPRILKRCQG